MAAVGVAFQGCEVAVDAAEVEPAFHRLLVEAPHILLEWEEDFHVVAVQLEEGWRTMGGLGLEEAVHFVNTMG